MTGKSFSSEELTIFNNYLDQEGKAHFPTDISVGTASPGMLRAHSLHVFLKKAVNSD